jgi:hypothetical protein
MMNRIDYEYYEWLVSQIHIPNDNDYTELFDRMHNLEFVWIVPRDDDRAHDGTDLRWEFLDGASRKLMLQEATILEVLIGLSRRVAFQTSQPANRWAWRLLKNLRLTKSNNPLTGAKGEKVEEILYNLVWRQYQPNGSGGFFPLKHTERDQTKINIWYQMHEYITEMNDR